MSNTRLFALGSGLVAAVLFITITLAEFCTRPGFSVQRHPFSMLSLGERGWLMVATFVICGILTVLFATAFWQSRNARIAAGLLGLFGVCVILSGFFPTRAAWGFPPRTGEHRQLTMDLSATIHSGALTLAFGSLFLGSLVLAVHYWRAGSSWLAVTLVASGLVMPVVIAFGMCGYLPSTIATYIAAVLAWQVIGLAAWRELRSGGSRGLAL